MTDQAQAGKCPSVTQGEGGGGGRMGTPGIDWYNKIELTWAYLPFLS